MSPRAAFLLPPAFRIGRKLQTAAAARLAAVLPPSASNSKAGRCAAARPRRARAGRRKERRKSLPGRWLWLPADPHGCRKAEDARGRTVPDGGTLPTPPRRLAAARAAKPRGQGSPRRLTPFWRVPYGAKRAEAGVGSPGSGRCFTQRRRRAVWEPALRAARTLRVISPPRRSARSTRAQARCGSLRPLSARACRRDVPESHYRMRPRKDARLCLPLIGTSPRSSNRG